MVFINRSFHHFFLLPPIRAAEPSQLGGKKSISEGLLSHLASEAPAANTFINYLKRS